MYRILNYYKVMSTAVNQFGPASGQYIQYLVFYVSLNFQQNWMRKSGIMFK